MLRVRDAGDLVGLSRERHGRGLQVPAGRGGRILCVPASKTNKKKDSTGRVLTMVMVVVQSA